MSGHDDVCGCWTCDTTQVPAEAEVIAVLRELIESADEDRLGKIGPHRAFPGPPASRNAPHHGHQIPGVWDASNRSSIAGKPCRLCAAWGRARAIVATDDRVRESGKAAE